MPFDNSRTFFARWMVVFARKPSAFVRSTSGCTPATQSSNSETRIHRGSIATSAMKETSRISSSRAAQGSRPSTFHSPSYDVSPRIAWSAVVVPAPFGPIIPRIRPSSTRKSMPSSATVVPNVLRRPRASMQTMLSAVFLPMPRGGFEQFFWIQIEPPNGRVNSGPVFPEKFLPLAFKQQISRARSNEHAEAAPFFDKLFVHQFLVSFEDSQRVDAVIGGDITH